MHLSDRLLLLFQVKNPLNRSQSVYDNWLDKFPVSDGRTPKWVIQHYYSGTTPFYINIATLLLQPIYSGLNKSSQSQTFSLLKDPFNTVIPLSQSDFGDHFCEINAVSLYALTLLNCYDLLTVVFVLLFYIGFLL